VQISTALEANKNETRLLWTIRDVSAQRRSERELHESRTRLKTIFEAASLGIALLSLNGQFVECNPAFSAILRSLDIDMTEGRYPGILFPDLTSEEHTRFGQLVTGKKKRYQAEQDVPREDNRSLRLKIDMCLLRDQNGLPQYALGIFEDVTRLHLREEEILLLERHLEEAVDIFQNCLTNALRHSGAQNVMVRLYQPDDHLVLEVEDNGSGFNIPASWTDLTRSGHYGLVGSAERAAGLGGVLQLRSAPGQGTLVKARIPLDEERQHKHSRGDFGPEIQVC
jgi:PAS domain S-box-containing protein